MAEKFRRLNNGDQGVRFSQALMGETEHSRMVATPIHITTFNAGDIVPIYCREILPDEGLSIDVDAVIRQTTLLTPTMGNMHVDIYAFFVPNRVVNQSWKAVQGENLRGSWVADDVSLVPLVPSAVGTTSVPVGSVADYYGFPTQQPISNSVLCLCHDLKFRGYVMIYNEFFRDQNYQPPISFSTLNVNNGFFSPVGSSVAVASGGSPQGSLTLGSQSSSGAVGTPSVIEAVYGQGNVLLTSSSGSGNLPGRVSAWSALGRPFKANKLHDYFTSCLPSPQKSSSSVLMPVTGSIPVNAGSEHGYPVGVYLKLRADSAIANNSALGVSTDNNMFHSGSVLLGTPNGVTPSNLWAQSSGGEELGLSVSDLRMAAAIQQVYEILARGGSRYREIVSSFFGISADDPFSDIPQCLGHISRDLDLYQTAQTSASEEGGTPQGNLSAFGYTATGGSLFKHRFLEHGYLHIFAVVRHRNLYSSFMSRDNFRLNSLDFYLPPLANISEQPVYTREINPFAPNPNNGFGFQEAWAEYRYEPDQVTGLMRDGVTGSLSLWNYSDRFDASIQVLNGAFLESNSESVLNRTLAVTSSVAPQFKAMFRFKVDKDLPMPTYSVPGMDII